MSENTEIEDTGLADKPTAESGDVELDNLLNDALNDFTKPMQTLAEPVVKVDEVLAEADTKSLLENIWNEPSMKEAMSHFEHSIRAVFSASGSMNVNGTTDNAESRDKDDAEPCLKTIDPVDLDLLIEDFHKMAKMTAETFSEEAGDSNAGMTIDDANIFTEEFSKSFMEVAQKFSTTMIKNDSSPANNDDEDDNSFHNMVTQTIKSLSENNKDLEGCTLNVCSEQLGKLLKDLENDDNVNKNFYKFMKICMKTMKMVVYPSLKDLCNKYPSYIEDSKSKLSETEIENYNKQYEVMDKICKLFETEEANGINDAEKPNSDSDEVDSNEMDRMYKRFLNILHIMKEMQDCGQIPHELVQKKSKFFEDIAANSDNQNGQNCSIL